MIAKLQTLIWYAICIVVLLVLYHVATSYTLVVIDEGYRYMEPTLKPQSTHFLDKSRSGVLSLGRDDLVAYRICDGRKTQRMFGRVLALPGTTVSVRNGDLLVEGAKTGRAPRALGVLKTGLLVPRDTVFVSFDSSKGDVVPVSQRLVPYRSIIGRTSGK